MPSFWNHRETELERELAHHLHQLTAQFERQGYSHEDAVRLANREFGGAAQVKEQCRDERRWAWTAGLRQDVTFGLRLMRRSPVVTVAAVLSLALGIGAHTAIISLMDVVLWRDLPVPEPRQLSLVQWAGHGFPVDLADGASGSMLRSGGFDVADFFSYPAFARMQRGVSRLAAVAAYTGPEQVSAGFAGRPTVAMERAVSGNFFAALEVQPQLGRPLADRDDTYEAPAVVVLSHRFWANTLGADPGVIGRTLTIDNAAYGIAGVLPPAFYGLTPGDPTELYTPLHHASLLRRESRRADLENNRYWGFQILARRSPGVDESRLRPAMDAVFKDSWTRAPKNIAAAPRIHLDPGARGLGFLRQNFRDPLLVLGGLVALLLLIACVNIANLLLARGVARQDELALRLSLGCSRARLMQQFLTESALLAVLGGLGSLGVAWFTATLLGGFLAGHETIPIAFVLDGRTLAVVAIGTLAALLVFGVFPAWQASGKLELSWLKEGAGSVGPRSRGWRSGRLFVGLQMALSAILVMTAVTFTRNLAAVQSSDPGFDRRNLILYGVRPGTSGYDKSRLPQFYFNLEQRLRATPGVAGVGFAGMRPMNLGGWWESVRLAGQEKSYDVSVNDVTPSYLPLYTTRMVAGRNFNRSDTASPPSVAIISADLARRLGGNVLGRRLEMTDGPPGQKLPAYEIVGIVPVIAATSIKEHPYVLWLPFESSRAEATVVLRTTQSPRVVLPAIRQAMAGVDRNLPMVDTITMEAQIAKGLQRERMFATLCDGFGTLALVLSVVGLYGVISYIASRRRREIGLRLALGAGPKNVAFMILRDGLATAAGGILLGLPFVWLGGKYLQKELTGMQPTDPRSLMLTLTILLVAACVAAGLPALRASRLDPAQTLRRD
ncbi:MAG TPA: ABC transporter permease [Bryobacteraceae bacterium]|nr:ABC transporter permease [Bryobacteraceae bacterium]